MQFTTLTILAAAAAGVSAWGGHGNDTVYTTEILTAYTTVCPASSTITFQGHTYTNTLTESTTITITNCPCTVVKPVTTTSSVATSSPVYANTTTKTTTAGGSVGTTSAKTSSTPTPISASSGNQLIALSGASLAGLLGLAAYVL